MCEHFKKAEWALKISHLYMSISRRDKVVGAAADCEKFKELQMIL